MTSRFRILRQGYDRFEVDRILEQYESQIKQQEERLNSYQNQLDQSQKQMELINERYEALQKQVAEKEKAVQQTHQLAIKESNEMIESANRNADLIISEALTTARLMLAEVSRLSEQTNQVKIDLKKQLSELTQLLDEIELPELPNQEWFNKQIDEE